VTELLRHLEHAEAMHDHALGDVADGLALGDRREGLVDRSWGLAAASRAQLGGHRLRAIASTRAAALLVVAVVPALGGSALRLGALVPVVSDVAGDRERHREERGDPETSWCDHRGEIRLTHPGELVARLLALGVEERSHRVADRDEGVELVLVEPDPLAPAAPVDLDVVGVVGHVLDVHHGVLAAWAAEVSLLHRGAGLGAIPRRRIGRDSGRREERSRFEERPEALFVQGAAGR
jgi:hypothetical protein